MTAAGRLDGNFRATERAFLGRGLRLGRRLFFLLELIYGPDQEKDREGDDDEIEDGVNEDAKVDGRRPSLLRFFERSIVYVREIYEKI